MCHTLYRLLTPRERVRIRDRYKYLEIIINCLKSSYKTLTTNRTALSLRMQAHLPFQDILFFLYFFAFDLLHIKGTRQGAPDRQLYIPLFTLLIVQIVHINASMMFCLFYKYGNRPRLESIEDIANLAAHIKTMGSPWLGHI